MELRVRRPAFWASLHLRSGLRDWDMAEDLGLGATTTDQGRPQGPKKTSCSPSFVALKGDQELEAPEAEASVPSLGVAAGEPEVEPHLWMWVNPTEVCSIPGHVSSVLAPASLPDLSPLAGPQAPSSAPAGPWEDPLRLCAASQTEKGTWAGSRTGANPGVPEKAGGSHRPTPNPHKPRVSWSHSRRLKRVQGGWPRPPLNYCILISLALSSSADSSLTVQEIYQFTRQHFPFFRTAPEGWKNTVRHNLCFSSSFEKTTDFVCLEGNRKARLWKLTTEGRRKFQEEAQMLPEGMVDLVHQSMEKPELMRSLFGL